MPRVSVPGDVNNDRYPNAAGRVHKLIDTTTHAWHATFPGGAAIAVTGGTGMTDPGTVEADRIPELALAGGGTPGTYTITGTWNGEAQTEDITTVAGATVKGDKPFDTITDFSGPDPGANLDLLGGDSYFDPPTRALWTGSAPGDADLQLLGETASKVVADLPANRDWPRRVRRIVHTTTTLTAPYAVW